MDEELVWGQGEISPRQPFHLTSDPGWYARFQKELNPPHPPPSAFLINKTNKKSFVFLKKLANNGGGDLQLSLLVCWTLSNSRPHRK